MQRKHNKYAFVLLMRLGLDWKPLCGFTLWTLCIVSKQLPFKVIWVQFASFSGKSRFLGVHNSYSQEKNDSWRSKLIIPAQRYRNPPKENELLFNMFPSLLSSNPLCGNYGFPAQDIWSLCALAHGAARIQECLGRRRRCRCRRQSKQLTF